MAWSSIALVAAVAAPFMAGLAGGARAETPHRISGPTLHENLAIYFIHGPSAPGPAPLTLAEAMAAGKVIVHETGNVSSLSIENTGTEEVFVQAGDIVKGGQQDRVLTLSFLVPPTSGRMPIAAYCVEQGRWSARGAEDVKRFASADKSLYSRKAKLAMIAPGPNAPAATTASYTAPEGQRRTTGPVQANRTGPSAPSAQSEVWASVSDAQRRLSANLGANVAAPVSASSLQLTLENQKLQDARAAFVKALSSAGTAADDIVGYVVAVSGRIESGDLYVSNALFRKMWGKQLDAAATAAIAEKNSPKTPAPDVDAVRAFLTRAEAAPATAAAIPGTAQVRETRAAEMAVLAETRRSVGSLIHRAYVAR